MQNFSLKKASENNVGEMKSILSRRDQLKQRSTWLCFVHEQKALLMVLFGI